MNQTPESARKILVAYDFSSASDVAADLAFFDLSDSRRGGRLLLVHVLLPLHPPIAMDNTLLRAGRAEIERAQMVEVITRIERVAERLRARRVDPVPPVEVEAIVRYGAPAELVVSLADERGADRIYVGAHDKAEVTRLLLGSVALRVIRSATVPVLVAHARERVPEVG